MRKGRRMTKLKINTGAPNLVLICVDEVKSGEGSGRMYHRYRRDALEFQETFRLIEMMDALFEEINYPEASTRSRTFAKKDTINSRKEAVAVKDSEELLGQNGKKATFVVHVQSRQNATWQGTVIWAEKEKTQHFRSALELLKLIDSAIDQTDEEK